MVAHPSSVGWMLSLGGIHVGWGASRRAPKGDESLLIPVGSPKELETMTDCSGSSSYAGGGEGSLLWVELCSLCPPFFSPSLPRFSRVS